MSELFHTPLFTEHVQLGAKCSPFGNWEMPIQYSGIIDERNHCRTKASLFDTCHMGILSYIGDTRSGGINHAVTIDITTLAEGRCSYGFLLRDDGTVIDDLIVYKISDRKLMIVINASTVEEDVHAIRQSLSEDESLTVVSPGLAKIDLQGPLSYEMLSKVIQKDLCDISYFSFRTFSYKDTEIIVSRTGYTGELGYELYVSSDKIADLWRTLLSYKEVEPAGLGARDLLRLEAGLPLSGVDINSSTTPLEAGLGSFVKFEKDFKGKEALLRQKTDGLQKKKIAFKTYSRRSPRSGYPILCGGQKAGQVTSGLFSPIENRGIGMGYVDTSYSLALNDTIQIDTGKKLIDAEIVELPFYTDGTARKKI